MNSQTRTYLMVLAVPVHRVDAGHFAVESAFAEHLRILRSKLGPLAQQMVLASPVMSDADYEARRTHLAVIDEAAEGIRFAGMFPNDVGRIGYARRLPGVMKALYHEVEQAAVVHAGPSHLYRLFEFPALLLGYALGKKTISVTDIDARQTPRMDYESGASNLREYLAARWLHGQASHLQHWVSARFCSLVLLKGAKMAQDYGEGRANVKDFFDTAYSSEHVISKQHLERKLLALQDPATPLKLTYFGRLVPYKGIDHMLKAISFAKGLGMTNFSFQIFGDGPSETGLRALAHELGLEDHVVFEGAVPFGATLFARLHDLHILLAAPLTEDTPRSALDAMASGQAVVAYNTYYYEDLAATAGAVTTVPWGDVQALGQRLFELNNDRARLAGSMRKAVDFADRNTQEAWLDRRIGWTQALFESL